MGGSVIAPSWRMTSGLPGISQIQYQVSCQSYHQVDLQIPLCTVASACISTEQHRNKIHTLLCSNRRTHFLPQCQTLCFSKCLLTTNTCLGVGWKSSKECSKDTVAFLHSISQPWVTGGEQINRAGGTRAMGKKAAVSAQDGTNNQLSLGAKGLDQRERALLPSPFPPDFACWLSKGPDCPRLCHHCQLWQREMTLERASPSYSSHLNQG